MSLAGGLARPVRAALRLLSGKVPRAENPNYTFLMNGSRSAHTHIGWVPTINGWLDFNQYECGMGNAERITESYFNSQSRSYDVILHTHKEWRDQIHPENHSGFFYITVVSNHQDKGDKITGAVHFVVDHKADEEYLNNQKCIRRLEIYRSEGKRREYFETVEKVKRYFSANTSKSLFTVKFELTRLGFVTLHLDESKLDNADKYDPLTKDVACRQSYYFIKYAWHRHKHHDSTEESLTTTYSLNSAPNTLPNCMLGDLKNSVVKVLRQHKHFEYGNSALSSVMGINAYAKSLANALAAAEYLTKAELEIELKFLDSTSESIKLSDERIKHRMQFTSGIEIQFRNFCLFCLAIFAPMLVVLRNRVNIELLSRENSLATSSEVKFYDYVVHVFSNLLSDYTWIVGAILIFVITKIMNTVINRKFGNFIFAFDALRYFVDRIRRKKMLLNAVSCILITVALFLFILSLGILDSVTSVN